MDEYNIDLLSRNKMLLDKQYHDSYSQDPPLVKNTWMSAFLTPSIK